jgi:hypothetical protein
MQPNKKLEGEELPKLNVTPILNKDKTELWYRLEKEQLERLEENKKSASDIATSLQNSIDRHRTRINEALTNEEKKALIQRMKQLMLSHEEQIYKEKNINVKIDAIKTKLYPRPKSGSDNVRLENGYKTPRGYTEQEKQELYKLIDSVV